LCIGKRGSFRGDDGTVKVMKLKLKHVKSN